ncbi:uncharacterized protein [Lepeophtheirus salmonis]|uniref:uncharacterized protein isoform X1 n=2 Tax=Lepeophtheirus salmonis TaxID=72036 RepID=UPI001AE4722E|nr:ras-like protein rasX isoform X1 [Lepeophtheirus salmonis]
MDYSMRHNSTTSGNGVPSGGGWSLTGPKTDWKVSTPLDIHSPPYKSANGTASDLSTNLVKLVILGAPGVGKTSIIQQFVWGTFDASYYPTGKKETYYPSVVLHDQHFDLTIVDIPDLPFLPVNNFNNLSDAQNHGLTDATAYVLVFDLLCPDSFEYISGIYSQICEVPDLESIPIIVIGNKADKVELSLTSDRNNKRRKDHHERDEYHHHNDHDHDPHGHDFSSSFGTTHHHQHHYGKKSSNRRSYSKDSYSSSSSKYSSHKNDYKSSKYVSKHRSVDVWGKEAFFDKDIADRVISEWKATYRECAAKDSESVTELFKAIMDLVEENQFQNAMNAEVNKKCTIL